ELGDTIASLCKTNGLLAISGILDNQADPTRAAYQQWFKMERPSFKEEWSLLHGQKQKADG
ncbi:MAG: 50S ribosomal protein L11 methyltransferase, partial [Kangiellaceae bacterium]|nr:50S ribosomal protein L11 methyltransferase [Kangiellaceae bacterium]